jgi:hypothetical protein
LMRMGHGAMIGCPGRRDAAEAAWAFRAQGFEPPPGPDKLPRPPGPGPEWSDAVSRDKAAWGAPERLRRPVGAKPCREVNP